MQRYKRKFVESTEIIPYEVYGKGDSRYFLLYFLNLYNKNYKTSYTENSVKFSFKEAEKKDIISAFSQKIIRKAWEIYITDKKTYNYLYEGVLILEVDFSGEKINSKVIFEANEKSPIGRVDSVTFVFGK